MSNPFEDINKPRPCPKGYFEEVVATLIIKLLQIEKIKYGSST